MASNVVTFVIASFTVPERIGVNLKSMLLLLPLVAAIAVVYKATKIPTIKPTHFFKESVILFGSIVVFMAVTALVLGIFTWIITE